MKWEVGPGPTSDFIRFAQTYEMGGGSGLPPDPRPTSHFIRLSKTYEMGGGFGVVNMFGSVIPPSKFTTSVDFLTFAITARNYVVSLYCVR